MISNKDIDHGSTFDWGKTSRDYAKFRDIYPEQFYQNILDLGLCVKGQDVLDLGTGTGVLPRNLYRHGAKFTGADISENQIVQARRLSAEAGMDIAYVISSAEDVSFPDNNFDVVTACQCFIYFNKAVALPKIHRMLRDGGHFCILWMAWLPAECEIAARSEALVLKYNPSWTGAGAGRYMPETPKEAIGLFDTADAEAFDLSVQFTRESWHGRIKACRGVGASSLPAGEIEAFEREHLTLVGNLPESFDILHFATVLNLKKI